ncbi:MAG TPA: imidazole glycerol phosphate synthase subunit HisH [Candidatus Peribacterales bacterium]|nr:imidazole glycerol phosphate synthase subunit HisH [Candidatus Peribacterales bacterium]
MIAIVDYGIGNLRSIAKGFEEVGGDVIVTNDHEAIRNADRIVLPGVGAFGDGMKNIRERGLDVLLTEEVRQKGKPFLGVCLGMQLICTTSEEFGDHKGLGWIDADVKKFSFTDPMLRIPHVGWNTVRFQCAHPLREDIKDEADFYFVHSYYVAPKNQDSVMGLTEYGGDFVSALAFENIVATQFHPEKSQKDGLKMLKNFLTWNPHA